MILWRICWRSGRRRNDLSCSLQIVQQDRNLSARYRRALRLTSSRQQRRRSPVEELVDRFPFEAGLRRWRTNRIGTRNSVCSW
jgi:hypothetical protein